MGAALYCDDLILLSPTRSSLQKMLLLCEKYASCHNMVYSTDPNPTKSKTKCMYFCGLKKNVIYPVPVKLNGEDLPWVTTADHLGHTFHQSCSMQHDIRIKRAKYIDKTTELRNSLSWAHPCQIMKAGDIYAGDHYGSNLWLLNSDTAEMYFKSWNTFVKLCWGVPRSTHTFLVENVFAKNFIPARHQVLGRYVSFLKSLLSSPSREVRILTRNVIQDISSVTRQNIDYIERLSGLSPLDFNKSRITKQLPKSVVKDTDVWRISLLLKLLDQRRDLSTNLLNTDSTQSWIDSLCST